jgi:uncharacterized protein
VTPQARTITTPLEAIGICTLCFGWFILASVFAVSTGFRTGSFSDQGFAGLILFELFVATIALYVLRSRGFSTSSLYPAPSLGGVGVGSLLYLAVAFAAAAATSTFATSDLQQPIDALMGNTGISLVTLVALGVVNGAYEEIFLLGFLLRGLREYGLAVALGASLLVRVLYHLYQGPLGAVSVLVFGAVLSLSFIATGRLFPAVFAHALADIVPFLWRT